MKDRITNPKITSLNTREVFIFGSNESGFHGAGAARIAHIDFGAPYRMGFGYYECSKGRTFAIPTKDWLIGKLDKERISFYVDRFVDFATYNPQLTFLVTQIGCGLAGYTPKDIAPMFSFTRHLENVHLPKEFWEVLNEK
jgi:hypothetical protein